MQDYMETYLTYNNNNETATQFHRWAALFCLAASVERKVWVNFGYSRIFPNLYIALVAPSGIARKNNALKIARDFLMKDPELDIRIVAEKTSLRELTASLAEAQKDWKLADGSIYSYCALNSISFELSVVLGGKDPELLSTLTDLYDSHEEWTYKTHWSGTDKVKGVYLNIIGGTTPDFMSERMPASAMGEGLAARMILVYANKREREVPFPYLSEENKEAGKVILQRLYDVHSMYGNITFSVEAKKVMTEWYLSHPIESFITDDRFTGYYSKMFTNLIKMCILFCISDLRMEIIPNDFTRSVNMMGYITSNIKYALGGQGKSRLSSALYRAELAIKNTGIEGLDRHTLLAYMIRDVSATEFYEVMRTLIFAKKIAENGNRYFSLEAIKGGKE